MNGAMGAYAISTGKIYLNKDWLLTAGSDAVGAVLTEELGHHLDGLVNSVDTLGDEGTVFAAALLGIELTQAERTAIQKEDDQIRITVNGEDIKAEAFAVQAAGTGPEEASGITALSDGSSLITGVFQGTASFGSTTLTSAGDGDVFVAKINADGSYSWATQAGGRFNDKGWEISSLSDGTSLVTGSFSGTASFGGISLTSTGLEDVFVAKLNADGTFAWATQAGGASSDTGLSITALSDGSSIATGYFRNSASFGGATLSSTGFEDVFVAKLNADGTFAWAAQGGGRVWI